MIKSHVILANKKEVHYLLKIYEPPFALSVTILSPPGGEAKLSKKELKETEQLIFKRLGKISSCANIIDNYC